MNVGFLIIWFKCGEVCASVIDKLPNFFTFEGKSYHPVADYLGDADYLRDNGDRLAGFSYILGNPTEREGAIHEGLIGQSKGVKQHNGMLLILIKEVAFKIQCVQAVGTTLYRSSTNEMMLMIPNWEFGELAFQLITTDTPLAMVSNI